VSLVTLPRRALRGVRRTVNGFRSRRLPPVPLDAPSAAMPVVFVGGTGRSGTTVTGRLIASHPRYALVRVESKFISARGGLCDLALGATGIEVFEERILGRWFRPPLEGGLFRIMDEGTIRAALPALRANLAADPWRAAAAFAHALLDPIAFEAGAEAWVDMDPGNVYRGDELLRMFPRMRLVHSVRDGRDVVASVVPLHWGPSDPDEALEWWHEKLDRAFAATARVPAGRVLAIQMEDLVSRAREREYRRILDFLGLADDAAMRAYFDANVTEAKSHIGRWRKEVPAARLAEFERRHDSIAEEMARHGRPYVPVAAPPPSPDLEAPALPQAGAES
jgi:sulfotransferase family protein